jgi:hypothetical protein
VIHLENIIFWKKYYLEILFYMVRKVALLEMFGLEGKGRKSVLIINDDIS